MHKIQTAGNGNPPKPKEKDTKKPPKK